MNSLAMMLELCTASFVQLTPHFSNFGTAIAVLVVPFSPPMYSHSCGCSSSGSVSDSDFTVL